jgi:hypothetical protein
VLVEGEEGALGLTRSARLVEQVLWRLVACVGWVTLWNKALEMMADVGLMTIGIHYNMGWVGAYEGMSMIRACGLEMVA